MESNDVVQRGLRPETCTGLSSIKANYLRNYSRKGPQCISVYLHASAIFARSGEDVTGEGGDGGGGGQHHDTITHLESHFFPYVRCNLVFACSTKPLPASLPPLSFPKFSWLYETVHIHFSSLFARILRTFTLPCYGSLRGDPFHLCAVFLPIEAATCPVMMMSGR